MNSSTFSESTWCKAWFEVLKVMSVPVACQQCVDTASRRVSSGELSNFCERSAEEDHNRATVHTAFTENSDQELNHV